ncbi:hypothetical protein MSPP1_000554 [Malassezia sp. CBS 17886]|nr:hypothetical protein MSPP1_000554 [Malassezia sp. CBS 17886]
MTEQQARSGGVAVNARGIPTAPFITDVSEHIGGENNDVMPALQQLQEAISCVFGGGTGPRMLTDADRKYKYMEASTAQRRKGLEQKIPDISKTLDMVRYLKAQKDAGRTTETTFEMSDTLFARATVAPVDRVNLWLGVCSLTPLSDTQANVMLSYEVDEASAMLSDKLRGAKESLAHANEDLGFLRDQITTMEVNMARVHNWDVKRRRMRASQGST